MIIAIKNNLEMNLYFIKREEFFKLFEENINSIDNFLKIVNRWEGNSIRVDREEFLKIATHIKLDFNFIKNSILKYFQEFEDKTTKILVQYINDIENKEFYHNNVNPQFEIL